MKDLVEKLKSVNDELQASNELAEKDRLALLQQLNNLLVTMLLAILEKNLT